MRLEARSRPPPLPQTPQPLCPPPLIFAVTPTRLLFKVWITILPSTSMQIFYFMPCPLLTSYRAPYSLPAVPPTHFFPPAVPPSHFFPPALPPTHFLFEVLTTILPSPFAPGSTAVPPPAVPPNHFLFEVRITISPSPLPHPQGDPVLTFYLRFESRSRPPPSPQAPQ